MIRIKPHAIAAILLPLLAANAAFAQQKAPVAAIFDFGMKSGGDDWIWLEKGLADMFTTHFVRSGVPVIARDEMENLAMKIRWVPEMRDKEKETQDIKNHLKVSYLVTGTYTVKDDQIAITVQVVNISSRTEVLRKEITGPAADVLELQTKLAAEVIPFFRGGGDGGVKEQALPELTPWTRSIPAAKALYAGIHLYDQGRYGEAWVQFRRAEATDPQYHDAAYWVARMYYFMHRFEHARLAYEEFIYQDTSHPRAADAVKEYLHTIESLNPPPETLLKLYAALRAAYPNIPIDMGQFRQPLTNERWLELREAQLRGEIGQHQQAIEIASNAPKNESPYVSLKIAGHNADIHNLLTGEVLLPKSVSDQYQPDHHVQFTLEKTDVTVKSSKRGNMRVDWYVLSAPSGYIFKSIHAYLIGPGTTERMGMHLHKNVYGDVPLPSFSRAFPMAREEGFLFNNLPRCGFITAHYWLYNPPEGPDPTFEVQAMRFVAELEKVGPHGAIEALCDTTGDFRVDVDGRMGRWGSGLVGLIPPGEHTLRFYSAGKQVIGKPSLRKTPYREWTTTVNVLADHVTPVIGHLPWADDSPWRSWDNATLVGKDYPGYFLGNHPGWSMPCIQADNESIRLVWSYNGDLWWSESLDAKHYSPPARFALPISSSWEEEYPRLFRDESGRFVLVFLSDRNVLRERRAYVSWSRDFQHWSAPSMIADRPVENYDILQDNLGRYLYVDAYANRINISESRDLYRWSSLSEISLNDQNGVLKLVQRPDGQFDLIANMLKKVEPRTQYASSIADNVGIYHSNDALHWTPRNELTQLRSYRESSIAVIQPQGRQILAYFSEANRTEPMWLQFQERDGQQYKLLPKGIGGIASHDATLVYHPKWGYLMAWSTPRAFGWGNTVEGPFIMRGQSIDDVMNSGDLPHPPPPTP
jgi:TolB-like protein